MALPKTLVPDGTISTIIKPQAPFNIPSSEWRVDRRRSVSIPLDRRKLTSCGCPELSFPQKTNADGLDYALDCTNWLNEGDDTLTSCSITSFPLGLVLDWSTIIRDPDTQRIYAVAYIRSGTNGTKYVVEFQLLSSNGRIETIPVDLPVVYGASNPPQIIPPSLPDGTGIAPNAVQIPDTSILTDNSGTPFIFA